MSKLDLKKYFLITLKIEGVAPEGALKRLRAQKIPLYFIKKSAKNRLELCVQRKFEEKVFTILDGSCYNVTRIGMHGLARAVAWAGARVGSFLGAGLLLAVCALTDIPVLKIRVTGASYLEKPVTMLAQSCGVKFGATFNEEQSTVLTNKILAMDGVIFCTVQKSGCVLKIDVRAEEEHAKPMPAVQELLSPVDGKVVSLTVLSGEPQAAVGDQVKKGQALVLGENVRASVTLSACAELFIGADSELSARAQLYLALQGAEIISHSLTTVDGGFKANVEYRITVNSVP